MAMASGQEEAARKRPLRCWFGAVLIMAGFVHPKHIYAQPTTVPPSAAPSTAPAAPAPSPAAQPAAPAPPAGVAPSAPPAAATRASPSGPPTTTAGAPSTSPPKTLGQSFIEGAPSIVAAVIGVLLTAIMAWLVGLRLAAVWDLRKKRTEIDLQLTQDLNKVIAEFKAIGREREALREAAKGAKTDALEEEIRKSRPALVSRAIAAESSLEAILLKMLGDMEAALAHMPPTGAERERARQIRIMGLTRVAFRLAREKLAEGSLDAPGYGEAPVWLFNRLAADLTGIIVARATLPPSRRLRLTRASALSATASYLSVIAYRTVDLQMAEAAMRAAGEAYGLQRDAARRAEWLENVRRALRADRTVVFESKQDVATRILVGDDDPRRSVIVHVAARGKDAEVEAVANALFKGRGELRWYVALVGGGARMLLQQRGGPMKTLRETDRLPEDLVHEAGIPHATGAPPPQALILLGWHQAGAASADIVRMAEVELGEG